MSVNMNVLTAVCGAAPSLDSRAATRRAARSAPIRSRLARAAVSSSSAASASPRSPQGPGQHLAGLRRLVGDVNLRPHADPSAKILDRVFGPKLRHRDLSAGHQRRPHGPPWCQASRLTAPTPRARNVPARRHLTRSRSRPPPAAPASGPRAPARPRLPSASKIARRAALGFPSSRRSSAKPGCGSKPSSAACRKDSLAPCRSPRRRRISPTSCSPQAAQRGAASTSSSTASLASRSARSSSPRNRMTSAR